MDGLAEAERAFLDALERWVELGVERPTGPLWDKLRARGPCRDDEGRDDPAFDGFRFPQVLLGRMQGDKMRALKRAAAQSLCKFVSNPQHVFHCLAFVARSAASERERERLLESYVAAPELPEMLCEWARGWVLVMRNPAVFGDGAVNEHFAPDCGLGFAPLRVLFDEFAFEHLCAKDVTEEQADSELFAVECREVQSRLLDWTLRGWVKRLGSPQLKLLRRVLDMARRAELLPRSQLALSVANSVLVAGFESVSSPDDLADLLRQLFRGVGRRDLEEAARGLLEGVPESDGYSCHSEVCSGAVFVMRQLLLCGASPLLRDASGSLLLSIVRSGRGSVLQRGIFRSVEFAFASESVQRDMARVLEEFSPTKWSREKHLLYPPDFRAQAFLFLLTNARLRRENGVWLPRDAAGLVLERLASVSVRCCADGDEDEASE